MFKKKQIIDLTKQDEQPSTEADINNAQQLAHERRVLTEYNRQQALYSRMRNDVLGSNHRVTVTDAPCCKHRTAPVNWTGKTPGEWIFEQVDMQQKSILESDSKSASETESNENSSSGVPEIQELYITPPNIYVMYGKQQLPLPAFKNLMDCAEDGERERKRQRHEGSADKMRKNKIRRPF